MPQPRRVRWVGCLPMPGSLKESSGTGVFQKIARVSEAAWPRADPRLCPCSSSNWGPSWWPQTLCWPFIPGTGSVLPHPRCLPFKERGELALQLALTVTSLLIQRIQKKITGAPLLLPLHCLGACLFSTHSLRVYPYDHQAKS